MTRSPGGNVGAVAGELRAALQDMKTDIIRYMLIGLLVQGALVVTLVKLLPGK